MRISRRSNRLTAGPARRRVSVSVGVDALEGRALMASLVGLTETNELVRFEDSAPKDITSRVAITGIAAGERILAIDYRPATGQLVGLGSTNRLYVLNASTGAATAIGTTAFTPTLNGTGFGLDFNPVVDRIRLVSDADQNLRLNPITGDVAGTDTTLAFAAGDPNAAANPNVVSVAYTDNFAGTTTTTLYGIDSKLGILVRQGSVGGTPVSPNGGQLTTIGSLGAPPSTPFFNTSGQFVGVNGFDIAGDTGQAFAVLSSALTPSFIQGPTVFLDNLYRINLTTGAATQVGIVGAGLRDLAIVPRTETLYAVAGSNLVTFRSDNPGTPLTSVPITGLDTAETIVGLDFRPANGQLIALGSSSRLYSLAPGTGVATAIGTAAFIPPLDGTSFGFDFNPVVDRIRVVSGADQNLRLNPITGAVATEDTDLAYATGDANFGANPNVVAVAYTNSVAGATTTTLYGIDVDTNALVLQGSLNGTPNSPNGGLLTTVGALGVDVTSVASFDIAPDRDAAYAVMTTTGDTTPRLYRINLATGAATLVGSVGGTGEIRALAVAPTGSFQFAAAGFTVSETAGTATIVVTRTGGSSGAASVAYATSNGTATAGQDYAAQSGVLNFADGETVKTFTIPITFDGLAETNETVNLTLSAPTAGSTLGTDRTSTLTITNVIDTTAPTLVNAGLFGASQSIRGFDLKFSETLDPTRAGSVFNYVLFGRLRNRNRTEVVAIASATYDDATQTVRVQTAQPFALSRYRSLTIVVNGAPGTGITDRANNALDGDGNGQAGGNAVIGYAVGSVRTLTYLDSDGDRVRIGINRGGKLELTRRLDGEMAQVWVVGASAARSVLTGTIRQGATGAGETTIQEIVGLAGVNYQSLLLNPRFKVGKFTLGNQAEPI